MTNFLNYINQIRIQDIVDILVITFIIYHILGFVKQTRAEQLIKGIFIILILTKLSEWLQLFTLNFLLTNLITVGAFLLIVVFQPELRRGLERIGTTSILPRNFLESEEKFSREVIDSITSAVASLSRQKIGALIVIEKTVGLKEIVDTGTMLNAKISPEILINIFFPNAPLHDGALIIKNDQIIAAGCYLPLSDNMRISKEMGTRHRAALGLSEKSDALCVIVSEETGTISIAENGEISRYLDIDTLENILEEIYTPKAFELKRVKRGKSEDEEQ